VPGLTAWLLIVGSSTVAYFTRQAPNAPSARPAPPPAAAAADAGSTETEVPPLPLDGGLPDGGTSGVAADIAPDGGADVPVEPEEAPPRREGVAAVDLLRALKDALQEAEGIGRDPGVVAHAAANVDERLRYFARLLEAYRSVRREGTEAAAATAFAQKADHVGSRLMRACSDYSAAATRALGHPGDYDTQDLFALPAKELEAAAASLRQLEPAAARAP